MKTEAREGGAQLPEWGMELGHLHTKGLTNFSLRRSCTPQTREDLGVGGDC